MFKKSNLPGSKTTYESAILHKPENEERKRIISTGSKNLDALLGGGIKTSEVTEFHGESLVGKSQLCHGVCVFASQYGKSIFIDTECSFQRERIREIASARGYDSELALKNTENFMAYSCDKQEQYLIQLEEQFSTRINAINPYILMVVDSAIANYKAEFSGRGNLSRRQQRLYAFMNKVKKMAYVYNIAVVITNHINEIPDAYEFFVIKPAGGNAMACNITHRMGMRHRLSGYSASIYSSKYLLDRRSTHYSIYQDGVNDCR